MFELFGVVVLLRAEQRKPEIPTLCRAAASVLSIPPGLYSSCQLRSHGLHSSWDERDVMIKDPGCRNVLHTEGKSDNSVTSRITK